MSRFKCERCDGVGSQEAHIKRVTCPRCDGTRYVGGRSGTFWCNCEEGTILVECSETQTCSSCKGSGYRDGYKKKCYNCSGSGKIGNPIYEPERFGDCPKCNGSGEEEY